MNVKSCLLSIWIVCSGLNGWIDVEAAGNGRGTGQPPNVVVILVDDLGYGDVNLGLPGIREFNNPHIKTPSLSRLARESLVFRHHYATALQRMHADVERDRQATLRFIAAQGK